MNHNETKAGSPPMRSLSPGEISSGLRARFEELPGNVLKMMEERGVTTPTELRSSDAFMRFLEQNLHPNTLRAVADPHRDLLRALSAVRSDLSSRSAEALAIHLYTKELLRLVSVAAARQHLAAARNR